MLVKSGEPCGGPSVKSTYSQRTSAGILPSAYGILLISPLQGLEGAIPSCEPENPINGTKIDFSSVADRAYLCGQGAGPWHGDHRTWRDCQRSLSRWAICDSG